MPKDITGWKRDYDYVNYQKLCAALQNKLSSFWSYRYSKLNEKPASSGAAATVSVVDIKAISITLDYSGVIFDFSMDISNQAALDSLLAELNHGRSKALLELSKADKLSKPEYGTHVITAIPKDSSEVNALMAAIAKLDALPATIEQELGLLAKLLASYLTDTQKPGPFQSAMAKTTGAIYEDDWTANN
ncbi:MAG: hypothetical protein K0S29_527 [Gammaproteobacteria bacterium]|nr:hypothetical protein [Gammaproteobacteria bacterium]